MNVQALILCFILAATVDCSYGSLKSIGTLNESQCQPWSFLGTTNKCQCYDNKDKRLIGAVSCTDHGSLLQFGYCMTYEEHNGTFLAQCPYFDFRVYNVSKSEYIQLPDHLSQLNNSMCDPLNRKGRVCSECKEGYALAINSYSYKCVKCSDRWYEALSYILMEFVPITVFYFVILAFRVSVTSAPMTCFIIFGQLIVYVFRTDTTEFERIKLQSYPHFINTIKTMYGISNLEFFQYTLPDTCVNSNLKIIHIQLLGYIPAFYALCLVTMTWICIELHDHNFRPLVWLWRPFHKCCVQLRREWNLKYDIIDVFASFFFLSSSRLMYQSLQLLGVRYLWNKNGSQELMYHRVTLFDPTVTYFSSRDHLPYAIIGIVFLFLFSILPTLVLIFYPTRAFRACTSICKLTGHSQAALQTFVEKFHNCYRDGLDEGRDMRSFSGLYFLLRGVTMASHELRHTQLTENTWFFCTVLFSIAALVISYLKPYKKWYMNLMDTLLLSFLALFFLLVNVHTRNRSQFLHAHSVSIVIGAVASTPLFVFLIYGAYSIILKIFPHNLLKKAIRCNPWRTCGNEESYKLLV